MKTNHSYFSNSIRRFRQNWFSFLIPASTLDFLEYVAIYCVYSEL